MKKRYYILFFLFLAFLLRGQLFRFCVSYEPVGTRLFIPLDEMDEISRGAAGWAITHPDASAKDIIAFARRKTAQHASFVMRTTSGNPRDVMASGRANCVGYARLFAAILDQADTKGQLDQEILIGRLTVFGQSLHALTNDPFWSDHDYNKVVDKISGEVFFLDATLYDYSGVKFVR
ncbi:hypothetical protein FUA23_12690 [Neolewinella aurantiaca]|uniref:Transglutaminase-like domain-containing protein n=1 Tax=Neolewinella aurantiaca TaxID=2602767 RepID=A0A5C7FF95_9BACT|nr:hypothetical protein [Neolewinella aurantiaca]TXF88910.1 hypothetical protein FUA23_12690 [Neolewinella aurantiaca]